MSEAVPIREALALVPDASPERRAVLEDAIAFYDFLAQLLPEVLAECERGKILLVTPTQRSAEGWVRRLRSEGKSVAHHPDDWEDEALGQADVVVGTRAAAFARGAPRAAG